MKLPIAALALAAAAHTASAASAGQCLSAVSAYAQSGQLDSSIEWNSQAAYYHVQSEQQAADEDGDADGEENNEEENNEEDNADDEEQKDGEGRRRRLEDREEAEEEAEQAETTIYDQMQGLAEALGINEDNNQDNEDGEDQQYQDLTYVMAYDEDLAQTLGIEDRDTFAAFYEKTYELYKKGGCSRRIRRRLEDGKDNEDGEDNDANEEEQEDNNNEDEAEGDADQDAEEEQASDLVTSILTNCQDSYADIGINFDDINEDGKFFHLFGDTCICTCAWNRALNWYI
jgi:hypothetical protein